MIMQWNGYSKPYINTTTLADAILKMTTALGANNESIKGNITYYDFRSPEANEMMIIVDGHSNGDSFSLLIPSTITLHNASFAQNIYSSHSVITVDGTVVSDIQDGTGYGGYGKNNYGYYNASLLKTDILHTVTIAGYNLNRLSTILIYRHD